MAEKIKLLKTGGNANAFPPVLYLYIAFLL